ncbi:hypothetical protein CBOM_01879 [Ceraceosorus bombacis]|uniref:Uncharacterized protein n=1 Tax=Ceraceosorus bombacis TaxID=401625 RepID=A0A0P1BDV7_9BASI|nr:hypothetical protein CBOM_01879 [Ceraceosorus bombacis]
MKVTGVDEDRQHSTETKGEEKAKPSGETYDGRGESGDGKGERGVQISPAAMCEDVTAAGMVNKRTAHRNLSVRLGTHSAVSPTGTAAQRWLWCAPWRIRRAGARRRPCCA